jgi:hypothetical protein
MTNKVQLRLQHRDSTNIPQRGWERERGERAGWADFREGKSRSVTRFGLILL